MENPELKITLPKFVQQISACSSGEDRPLTVNDLRLGIRNVRMSEIIDWSNHDLDAIEAHAAQFDNDAPLESVLAADLPQNESTSRLASTSICSPSPFAWT